MFLFFGLLLVRLLVLSRFRFGVFKFASLWVSASFAPLAKLKNFFRIFRRLLVFNVVLFWIVLGLVFLFGRWKNLLLIDIFLNALISLLI